MKFSIITVCFNSANVLSGAMQSLAAQTWCDYEWVVVDGGSSDGTIDLARTFTAAPMQSLSEPDPGIYDAMNKAIGLARGEYLYFLNSDDRLAGPSVLADVAQALDTAAGPDLLIGQVLFVGESGCVRRSYDHVTPCNVLFESLCHQGVFAHHSLFDRYGRFDIGYRMAADFDWLARVMRAGARVVRSSFLVAEFSTGGAHTRAQAITVAEVMRIRRAQTTPVEYALTHALLWVRHKAHRLARRPPRGAGLGPGGATTVVNDPTRRP